MPAHLICFKASLWILWDRRILDPCDALYFHHTYKPGFQLSYLLLYFYFFW